MQPRFALMAVLAALSVTAAPAAAQHTHPDPVLHVDPRWKECSFKLDASLTQAQWAQFSREAGLVAYFRPLNTAEPLGRGKVQVSALQWKTGIDHHDDAWNNTFVHPDSVHWLAPDDGLAFPGITARVGVTNSTDVGLYYTRNPNANYGFYGLQVQQQLLNGATDGWDVAGRASIVNLFGPEDVAFRVMGIDVLASRDVRVHRWLTVAPYAGVSGYVTSAHEKSNLVDLDDERALGMQGMVGAEFRLGWVRLAAEYNMARVNSTSLRIGFGG